MFTLVFQPNVGAVPFLFGSFRKELRGLVPAEPRVTPSQSQYDKYARLGLFLGYDAADRLNYVEVFLPSNADYNDDDLNSVPMDVLVRKLADERSYFDSNGMLIFTKYGIVLGNHGGTRSASLFVAGCYDALITKIGPDRLLRHVT